MSRLRGLVEMLEAGDTPTPEKLRRIATLQALDVAEAGEQFQKDCAAREATQTENFRKFLETI